MRSTLSVLGLYNYYDKMFDEFRVPVSCDKQDIVDNICLEFAELEVIYPDPFTMRRAIGLWSRQQLPVWEKLAATTRYEYNAIHNYDREEIHTDTETRDLQNSSVKGSSTTGSTENFGKDEQAGDTAGWNLGSMSPNNQIVTRYGAGNKVEGSVDTTDEGTDTGTIKHETTIRAFGNIGVTTTQQMIEAEREVVKFTVEKHIVEEFKKRFCIMVY